MKNQVTIIENSRTGNVVEMKTITDKETGEVREVGSVMVQSKALSGLGRIGRVAKRTAYLTLEADALEFLGDYLVNGAVLPIAGKIVIEETLKPYIRKNGTPQEPKINPKTKAVITYHGKPVYRNSYFTEDLNAQDVLLRELPQTDGSAHLSAVE
tara:strand:+ start:122 stop:586 length:465 start_codon:yes stop_codon:yes gene_type:complete